VVNNIGKGKATAFKNRKVLVSLIAHISEMRETYNERLNVIEKQMKRWLDEEDE